MVVVEKKNTDKLRICIDLRPVNKTIKREHYHLPTIEEITTRLSGAKYFSTPDARSGFWQIPLDEESSYLTTLYLEDIVIHACPSAFTAPKKYSIRGYMSFSKVLTVLKLTSTTSWGTTIEEHDEKLEKVLERAKQINLRLNPDKCQIRHTKVLYIGHVLTGDKVKPDASKLEAITEMPVPEDKHGIQRLLGMVNYMAKFAPHVSEVTAPLRELLKKDVA